MRFSEWPEFASKAAPFLESGETVHNAVSGIEGSRWQTFVPWGLGLDVKILAVTDLHVYLFYAESLNSPSPTAVAEKNDISDVEVEYRRSFPYSRLTFQSKRRQASRILWIGLLGRDNAEAIAEAIGSHR